MAIGLIGAVWFVAAFVAALFDAFVTAGTGPPIGIGVAAGVPPLAVLVALLVSPAFRAWAAALDPRLLIALQGWRIAGFVFVVLWAQGLLPAGFALPAGLGDVAIAVAAPFIGYASRRAFLVWTALGILDLVTAVTLGVLHGLTDPSMSIVGHLPLVLIPAFGVPFLLVVHLLSIRAHARGVHESQPTLRQTARTGS